MTDYDSPWKNVLERARGSSVGIIDNGLECCYSIQHESTTAV